MSNRAYVERRKTVRLYDGREWHELKYFADNVECCYSFYEDELDLRGIDLLELLIKRQNFHNREIDSDDDYDESEYNEDVQFSLEYFISNKCGITIDNVWFPWEKIKHLFVP